jgi:hypothetical protein
VLLLQLVHVVALPEHVAQLLLHDEHTELEVVEHVPLRKDPAGHTEVQAVQVILAVAVQLAVLYEPVGQVVAHAAHTRLVEDVQAVVSN